MPRALVQLFHEVTSDEARGDLEHIQHGLMAVVGRAKA